jgi:hypothetical protein
LREASPRFEAAGLAIVPIGQGTPAQLRHFLSYKDRHFPFPLYTDPQRISFRAYGLERGNWWQVTLAPKVLARGARAASKGHVVSKPVGDVKQMPGSFLVVDGIIRFARRGEASSDVVPPRELLAACC